MKSTSSKSSKYTNEAFVPIKSITNGMIILDDNYIKSKDIFKKELLIDLNVAYAEYIHQS